jgi:hypothetical protein
MITRVRETDGGYKVTILTAEGVMAEKTTPSLAEAFGWQAHIQIHGGFPLLEPEAPAPAHAPEVVKAKGKGRAK